MTDRPLRLGPDPNRTHLERWNEMHPDGYGRPDTPAETENGRHRWLSLDDVHNGPGNTPSPHGFMESFLGLAILILAPIIGLFVTLPLYQWTRPDNACVDPRLHGHVLGRFVRRRHAGLRAAPDSTDTGSSRFDVRRRILRLASVDCEQYLTAYRRLQGSPT